MAASSPGQADRQTIRALAQRWAEIAALPVMEERKRQWKALHDLRPERPMIHFETASIDGYVDEHELRCEHPDLREVEAAMRDTVRHFEEVGDDMVLDPYFRIGWELETSSWGVDVIQLPAEVGGGAVPLGYTFNFPIQRPEDVGLLKPRRFTIARERTLARQLLLEDAFGDLLPIRLGNYDSMKVGRETWVGNFLVGLTWQIYRFIGNDRLLYWFYEAPDSIHALMRYMVDDRRRMLALLEAEQVLVPNTDRVMAGPGACGYVSDLPAANPGVSARVSDLWCWSESQETTMISPQMFREFILPYYAEVSGLFGLTYYGCCEPLNDRLEAILDAIPNVRSVSVSAWSDFEGMAAMLGRDYVFSRKPNPVPISGSMLDWARVEDDLRRTYAAARDCNVELLVRDVYTIDGDRPRVARWVALARSIFGI